MSKRKSVQFLLGFLLLRPILVPGGIPIPTTERMLPPDTLLLLTTPDFSRLRTTWAATPQAMFLADPAMRLFVDNLFLRCREDLLAPLESQVGLDLKTCQESFKGQLTLAITRDTRDGVTARTLAPLVLVGTRHKGQELEKKLAEFRRKFFEKGGTVRTERIRGVEFTALRLSTNGLPAGLGRLGMRGAPSREAQDESRPAEQDQMRELFFGHVDSLLIASTSTNVIEAVLSRLSGNPAKSLGEVEAYRADHEDCFRESLVYGWVNVGLLMNWLNAGASPDNNTVKQPASGDLNLSPLRIMHALGFSGIRTLGFSANGSSRGISLQLYLAQPEAERRGLIKILASAPEEAGPPDFVPADAVKFSRWRIDGQKTWATLETTLDDISPRITGVLNFLLDSADTYAREKEPGFDIRKSLLGNLGNDVITYQRNLHPASPGEQAATSSLWLVGSTNASVLAGSLKSILVFLSRQVGTPPEERVFEGRTIYSMPLGSPALSLGIAAVPGKALALHYAAAASYLAVSTDASMLEDYLRAPEAVTNRLRDLPGLQEAARKVGGPALSFFGYENQNESMRLLFERLRNSSAATTNSALTRAAALFPGGNAINAPIANLREWMDFSLLPSYDKVAKYFSFIVYGGTATADRLTLKVFTPAAADPGH